MTEHQRFIDFHTPAMQSQIQAIEAEMAPLMAAQVSDFYQALRKIAARERSRLPGATLNTTGLVNELYLKLVRLGTVKTDSEQHFLALSAMAMRNILVDRSRRRMLHLDFQARSVAEQSGSEESTVMYVHEALERLGKISPRLEQVVVCRWFAGLSEIETADALKISERSVRRDWEKARLWLAEGLA